MERSTCLRVTLFALGCLAPGSLLTALAAARIVPNEASVPGMAAVLVGVGMLGWVGVHLWDAMKGEAIAYRVFYHADQSPDGAAITRMLDALARSAGHVSLVWRIESGDGPARASAGFLDAASPTFERSQASEAPEAFLQDETRKGGQAAVQPGYSGTLPANIASANVSLHIVAPTSARTALEGMLPALLPGVWAEKCAVPGYLKPPAPGWGVRAWKWDLASVGTGNLADPLACGANLHQLAAEVSNPAFAGKSTEIGEIEVRLTLWEKGLSAIVTAQCLMSNYQIDRAGHRPSPCLGARSSLLRVKRRSLQEPVQAPAHRPPPYLRPMLWGSHWAWTWCWPQPSLGPGESRLRLTGGRKDMRAGKPIAHRSRQSTAAHGEPRQTGLRGRLVSALAANYPLWDSPLNQRNTTRSRAEQSVSTAVVPGATGTKGTEATNERRARSVEGVGDLLFPATNGSYITLDSVEAGEVPLPPSYSVPPVPSQVLVLGSATCNGQAVGVPALSSVPSRLSTRLPSAGAASSATGVAGVGNADSYPPNVYRRLRLHPMLAEHLLVAGGSEAWRRDVAGSLVSQALDMGVTVVAVDGGSPPGEPPQSARKGSRVMSGDPRFRYRGTGRSSTHFAGLTGGHSAAGADPLSPAILRASDPALAAKLVAEIDMDNPAGSVHPNMLYVPAPPGLPPVQGEAIAVSLALEAGLVAQMRFLQSVNLAGIDTGMGGIGGIGGIADIMGIGVTDSAGAGLGGGGPAMAIAHAWLTVLLLRHHRARLLMASGGLTPDHFVSVPGGLTGSSKHTVQSPLPSLPSCPDLPALMAVLEQPDTLLNLLRREHTAWGNPQWASLVQGKAGDAGERALRTAMSALERALEVEDMDPHDMLLYGAALRGQLKRIIGHSAMTRMLSRPHISLAGLLDRSTGRAGGAGPAIRMLRVNLNVAYRTLTSHDRDEGPSVSRGQALVRKRYGLYLLWSLWAASQQRMALSTAGSDGTPHNYCGYLPPDPVLLVLHGAGEWFGSGSPLSEPSSLQVFGQEGSGIALAATVGGLHHLRAYGASSCEQFGNLVFGPAPLADADIGASDVTVHLVDQELRLLRDGMQSVTRKLKQEQGQEQRQGHRAVHRSEPSTEDLHREPAWHVRQDQALDGDRLLDVLRHLQEGSALVVTGMPGKRKVICTAHVGSGIANDLRAAWSSASSIPAPIPATATSNVPSSLPSSVSGVPAPIRNGQPLTASQDRDPSLETE